MTPINRKLIKPSLMMVVTCLFSLQAMSQISTTEKVIENLYQNNIKAVYKQLSPDAKALIPKKRLLQSWEQVSNMYGKLESHGEIQRDTSDLSTTNTELYLEKNTLIMSLKEGKKGMVDRFLLLPQSYSMPPAAKNIAFGKRLMTLVTDTFELDAELIFPLTGGRAPVVILVHGSGPMDMDETIGPNKVFKDLALELALRGVATLRYTKRSNAYPDLFANDVDFTLADETTSDVKTAVRMIMKSQEIDTNQVFVLGHSLGGYAAPMIGAQNPELKGVILLGGPAQPLYELIPMQYEYLFGLDDKKQMMKSVILKKTQKEAELLRNKEYGKLKKTRFATAYWPLSFVRDLEDYDPAKVLDTLSCSSLILQGSRDYQVPAATEFSKFKFLLSDNQNVTLINFDGLNHLFMYGTEKSVPSEYIKAGHVDVRVIEAIEKWIREQ